MFAQRRYRVTRVTGLVAYAPGDRVIGERRGTKGAVLRRLPRRCRPLLGMALAHDSIGLVILWSCLVTAGSSAALKSGRRDRVLDELL